MQSVEFANALVALIEEHGVDEVMGLPSKVAARAMLRGAQTGLELLADLETVGVLSLEVERD